MRQNDNSFSWAFYIHPPSSHLLCFSLSGPESNVQSISDIVTAIQGMSEGTFVNRFIQWSIQPRVNYSAYIECDILLMYYLDRYGLLVTYVPRHEILRFSQQWVLRLWSSRIWICVSKVEEPADVQLLPCRCRVHVPPDHCLFATKLHGIMSQKTGLLMCKFCVTGKTCSNCVLCLYLTSPVFSVYGENFHMW